MALEVDLNDPDGIPVTGIITSDGGGVFIGGLEVIKVTEATIRLDNNIGQYRPVGTKIACNYAGNIRVTGQITRAQLNLAELRLVMGSQPGAALKTVGLLAGAGAMSATQLAELLTETSVLPHAGIGEDAAEDHFYPLRADVSLIVNRQQIKKVVTDVDVEEEDGTITPSTRTEYFARLLTLNAKNCLFGNTIIAFDNTGYITSGPLSFMGGHMEWNSSEPLVSSITNPNTPTS